LAGAALIAVVLPALLTFATRDALVVMALALASGVLPLPSLLIAATLIAPPSHEASLVTCVMTHRLEMQKVCSDAVSAVLKAGSA
jgi:hypothetical protein